MKRKPHLQWILQSVLIATTCLTAFPLSAQEFADDFSRDSIRFSSGTSDDGSGVFSITEGNQGLDFSISTDTPDRGSNAYIQVAVDGDSFGVDFTHNASSIIESGFVGAFLDAFIYSDSPDYQNSLEGTVQGQINFEYDSERQLSAFYCLYRYDANGEGIVLPDACGQFEGIDLEFDQSYSYGIVLDQEAGNVTLSIEDVSRVFPLPETIFPPHETFKSFQLFHSNGIATASGSLQSVRLGDETIDMIVNPPILDRYQTQFEPRVDAQIIDEKLAITATSSEESDFWIDGELRLQQPSDYFEAELTLSSESDASLPGYRVFAGIEGIFFNTISDNANDGQNGDVRGSISLEAQGDGLRRIEMCLVRFDDADGEARTGLVDPEDPDNRCSSLPLFLEFDTSYRVAMALDRNASTFTFRVNGIDTIIPLNTSIFEATDAFNWVSISSRNGGIAVGTIDNIRTSSSALTVTEQQNGLTTPQAFPAPVDPSLTQVDSTITFPIDFFDYTPQYDFVDDFSGITSDFGFWSGRDRGGSGVSWQDGAVVFETSNAEGNDDGNFTEFYLDSNTDLLEAVVSLSSESRFEPGNTGAEISVRAIFYNDTQEFGFNDQEGDIEASLAIQFEGDGRKRLRARLNRRDAGGSGGDNLLDDVMAFEEGLRALVPELDRQYKLSLSIDRENGIIRYGVDDQFTDFQIPTGVFLPSQRRALISVNHFRGTGVAVGKIHSIKTDTIDEDFSQQAPVLAPYIPTFNAQRPGRVVDVVDGRLRLEADGNLTSGRDPGVEVIGASDFVGATIELSSESLVQPDGQVHVEVHGIMYNDLTDAPQVGSDEADSSEGRVFSTVRLTADGNGERFVQYCAFRSNTDDFSDSTELLGGDNDNCPRFSFTPELDTPYQAFIQLDRNAATLTFGFAGETAVYNIPTAINNTRPFNGTRARTTDNSKVVAWVDNLAFSANPLPLAESSSLLVIDASDTTNSGGELSGGSTDTGPTDTGSTDTGSTDTGSTDTGSSGGGSTGLSVLVLSLLTFIGRSKGAVVVQIARRSRLLLIAVLSTCALFSLNACTATTPENEESNVTAVSATALDSAAVLAHVSGRTETWSKGGGYYAPDGSLSAVWNGETSSGSWRLTEDGQICTTLDIWAPDEDCHTYAQQGEQVKLVYEGKATFREVFDGEQLDRF